MVMALLSAVASSTTPKTSRSRTGSINATSLTGGPQGRSFPVVHFASWLDFSYGKTLNVGGLTIDHKGLTPDVTVTLASPTDAYDVATPSQGYAKDAQLNAALALLPG